MKFEPTRQLVAVLLSVALTTTLHAQSAADFQTITINGEINNWIGNCRVGDTSCDNMLEIINGGVLSNAFGSLGSINYGNNTALARDTGSLRDNNGTLFVGCVNAGNQLVVTNAGAMPSALNHEIQA